MAGPAKVCLGAVAGAHGVRGDVRVKTFTEEPAAVAAYGPVATEDGRVFEITYRRPVKGGAAVTLKGVATREAAEALKGERLYVPRERLGEADADDDEEAYYHADLIGCVVVAEDGTEIGRVIAVHDFGAGDLLDVQRAGERRGRTVLVPFTRAVCPAVDLDARRIICVPPEGLLDDAADETGGEASDG